MKSLQKAHDTASIGIDLGGTNIAGIILNADGTHHSYSSLPTQPDQGAPQVLKNILSLIDSLMQKCSDNMRICAVGIGTPGFVDTNGIMIGGAENIPGWKGTDLFSPINEKYGVHVSAANDVTVAAFGEAYFGAGKGVDNMICIALGTGIGGGLVINGDLYKGSHGMAGEVGHIVVEENGIPCNCGLKGCAEQYASARGIVNLAKQMASEYREKSEFARSILADPDSLSAKTLYERVRHNDPFALKVHEYGSRMLGKLIGMLLNTLAVDRVVLSGGLMASADLIIPEVAHHVPQWCWGDIWERCEIVAGTLGDTAGSLGAAAMALEEMD